MLYLKYLYTSYVAFKMSKRLIFRFKDEGSSTDRQPVIMTQYRGEIHLVISWISAVLFGRQRYREHLSLSSKTNSRYDIQYIMRRMEY